MRTLLFSLAVGLLAVSLSCRTNETPEAQVKDARITATVKAKLASDLKPQTLTNVAVNVTNGVVTLSGLVSGAEEKRRAEEIARGVEGVARVNNELQVQAQT